MSDFESTFCSRLEDFLELRIGLGWVHEVAYEHFVEEGSHFTRIYYRSHDSGEPGQYTFHGTLKQLMELL